MADQVVVGRRLRSRWALARRYLEHNVVMDPTSTPPPLGTRMMAPRACTKCGARMPMDFSRPDVECRCPEGHEHWYFDRPDRKWRRIEDAESRQASAV